MAREDYQRAVADLLRLPQLCRTVRHGGEALFDEYRLTDEERERLVSLARHPDMKLQCMLYRASRLVGITRRLPASLALLGDSLRSIFDSYVVLHPDASAEFDREAASFGAFVSSLLDGHAFDPMLAGQLRSVLSEELARLRHPP